MVNEINKPPSSDHLNERLASSSRQLREMQEEHRQLLQEMETLRERANELNRLSQQRQQIQREQRENLQEIQRSDESATNSLSNESSTTKSEDSVPVPVQAQDQASQDPVEEKPAIATNEVSTKPNDQEDDAASAEYIKAKIAEIAALKAQYKRVQEMVQTTNLIEQHLSSKTVLDGPENSEETKQNLPATTSSSAPTTTTSSSATTSSTVETTATERSDSTTTDPKEELLNSMLGMFTNISDDLRGQAENLRAERERIRNLKELLIQGRKSNSKPNNG